MELLYKSEVPFAKKRHAFRKGMAFSYRVILQYVQGN